MSDEIEVSPALLTPAETPRLPAGLATPTPFTSVLYPAQWTPVPIIGRARELRGFYANNR